MTEYRYQQMEHRPVGWTHSTPASPNGQSQRRGICRQGQPSSTFLRPFAPPELPGFTATMDALTPARRLFVPGLRHMNTVLTHAGLTVSWVWPSDHSASNHRYAPVVALAHYPSARRASRNVVPLLVWISPLNRRLTGRPGRIEFTLRLRTGRSPPGALHVASRQRGSDRLQAGECVPEEDLHLSDRTHLQSHDSRLRGNDGFRASLGFMTLLRV